MCQGFLSLRCRWCRPSESSLLGEAVGEEARVEFLLMDSALVRCISHWKRAQRSSSQGLNRSACAQERERGEQNGTRLTNHLLQSCNEDISECAWLNRRGIPFSIMTTEVSHLGLCLNEDARYTIINLDDTEERASKLASFPASFLGQAPLDIPEALTIHNQTRVTPAAGAVEPDFIALDI